MASGGATSPSFPTALLYEGQGSSSPLVWFPASSVTPLTQASFSFTGGYERFSSEYPEFCSKTKALAAIPPAVPPSTAESPDLSCGSCGTPLHDQVGAEIRLLLVRGSGLRAPVLGEMMNPECWGATLDGIHYSFEILPLPSRIILKKRI